MLNGVHRVAWRRWLGYSSCQIEFVCRGALSERWNVFRFGESFSAAFGGWSPPSGSGETLTSRANPARTAQTSRQSAGWIPLAASTNHRFRSMQREQQSRRHLTRQAKSQTMSPGAGQAPRRIAFAVLRAAAHRRQNHQRTRRQRQVLSQVGQNVDRFTPVEPRRVPRTSRSASGVRRTLRNRRIQARRCYRNRWTGCPSIKTTVVSDPTHRQIIVSIVVSMLS